MKSLESRVARLEKILLPKVKTAGGGAGVRFDFSNATVDLQGGEIECIFDGDSFSIGNTGGFKGTLVGKFSAEGYMEGIHDLEAERFFTVTVDINKEDILKSLNHIVDEGADLEAGGTLVLKLVEVDSLGSIVTNRGYLARGPMEVLELPNTGYTNGVHFEIMDDRSSPPEFLGRNYWDVGSDIYLTPTEDMISLWDALFISFDDELELRVQEAKEDRPDVKESVLYDIESSQLYREIVDYFKN